MILVGAMIIFSPARKLLRDLLVHPILLVHYKRQQHPRHVQEDVLIAPYQRLFDHEQQYAY